jgi:hypothetical protein
MFLGAHFHNKLKPSAHVVIDYMFCVLCGHFRFTHQTRLTHYTIVVQRTEGALGLCVLRCGRIRFTHQTRLAHHNIVLQRTEGAVGLCVLRCEN